MFPIGTTKDIFWSQQVDLKPEFKLLDSQIYIKALMNWNSKIYKISSITFSLLLIVYQHTSKYHFYTNKSNFQKIPDFRN